MNKINPKYLKNSKWTKIKVINKEKHFIVTKVSFDENKMVTSCVIEAIMTKKEYQIDWHELKLKNKWGIGWQ